MGHRIVASVAAAVVASSVYVASDADAGGQNGPTEYCSTGVCYGTMGGFRNSSNAGDYAYFQATGGGGAYGNFYASYAGSYYSCYLPTGSPLISSFPETLSPMGFFWIAWNSSGQCTSFYLVNSSLYTNTW
jgi:hypothetical protein